MDYENNLNDEQIQVLQAREEDIEKISRFIKAAWRESGPDALGWTGATEETISMISSHVFLAELLRREDAWLFISQIGDRVVGFSSLRKTSEDMVELSGIIVMKSMTGKGVGSRLLDISVETAKAYGFNEMQVKTEKNNERAIGFYQSKGFKTQQVVKENIEDQNIELVKLTLALNTYESQPNSQ